MSSVPVQLLIYVRGPPNCSTAPIIIPLDICLEVQVGVPVSFDLYAESFCDPNVAVIGDIVISQPINWMTSNSLRNVTGNGNVSYITMTWTPQLSQVGTQQLCATAFTT